jgi:hypothetical protein
MRKLLAPLGLLVLLVAVDATAAYAESCKDFSSCEEAMKSFKSGNTRLDGDKDGIPCESLCGNK